MAHSIGEPGIRMNRKAAPIRNAVTLIEIVVGLVLLAMVLTSAVLAQKSHRQSVDGARRVEWVTEAADQILRQLENRRGGFPRRTRGRFDGLPGYVWTTTPIRREVVAGVAIEVVRWNAFGPDGRLVLNVDLALEDPTAPTGVEATNREAVN